MSVNKVLKIVMLALFALAVVASANEVDDKVGTIRGGSNVVEDVVEVEDTEQHGRFLQW
eukprot:CAMPEP_0119008926 /NCGR_PEP_ID=MMETSP1176-20130426/4030_1 /TAXON_ID=265551 /ORGANISM="Synedropsis recta cf, Strain CCMP1620" /LENGTH=58 /DNA_ID=CAMNT_0006961345 /DNA_START=94 /DNA_END=267 /DNA_ORIENTATION=-